VSSMTNVWLLPSRGVRETPALRVWGSLRGGAEDLLMMMIPWQFERLRVGQDFIHVPVLYRVPWSPLND